MPTLSNMPGVAQGTRFVAAPANPEAIPTNSVGGGGGQAFTYIDLAGISQLIAVPVLDPGSQTTFITQISVISNDGSIINTFGTIVTGSGTPHVLNLAGDSLKSGQLFYSPSYGGRVAGITLQTVNGQSFSVGDVSGTPVNLSMNNNLNVENYYIAGVFGNSAINVDMLGFYVVEDPIVRRVVQDFTYDLSGTPPVPTPVTLNTLVVENKSSEAQQAQIGFSEEVSSTSEWSNTAGITLGAETEIKTGIPFLAEGKIKLSVQASYEYSWGGSLTTSRQFNYQATVDVPSETSISASVVVLQADLSISYTATYLVERAHSGIKSQPLSGTYNGVSSYDVTVEYATVTG